MSTDTVQLVTAAEVTAGIAGKPGVLYVLKTTPHTIYRWNGTTLKEQGSDVVAAATFTAKITAPGADVTLPIKNKLTPSAITGTDTITAAAIATGALVFTGGAGTQTLPTAALLAAEIGAVAGKITTIDFYVDNTGGSGTCTIAASTGIVAGPAVITGGATLTVANSTTAGIGIFRIVFFSAAAAVVFRLG